MKHRPDIEGLRAVAVLLVVLAHAKVPGFSGGFVGVDVFFVMSGYLITGLLTSELQRSGKLDYWAFFARRARRLAPAMLLMLAVVSAACIALLPGASLRFQLDSGSWAAVWLSNVYFTFGRFDYFGAAAQDSLFLHTWSLGVEEQFYLLWPALVAWAWRRHAGGKAWLGWMVAASLALGLALMHFDATSAYYLMPSRLWQLALGGLVYRLFDGDAGARFRAHAHWLGLAGVAMLLASLALIDESVAYPGLWALLPALAAAGLLAAGTGQGSLVARGLGSRFLSLPGRISYGWYLWHWPLLMLGPLLGWWPLGGLESLAAILASFLVAWVSHAVVEEPIRRRVSLAPRRDVLASVLASLALVAVFGLAGRSSPSADIGNPSFEKKVLSLVTVPTVYADKRCDQWYHSAELVPCEVSAGDGRSGLMVLVGDSIGTQWQPALQRAAALRGMRLLVLTKSSCAIVDEPFVYARIHRRFTECEQWRDAVVAHVQALQPQMVVIGSSSTYGFTSGQWTRGSQRIVDRLGGGVRPVVVLAPSPVLFFDGPACVMANGRESSAGIVVEASACTASRASAENADVIRALGNATRSHAHARLVNLNDLVCPGGTCSAMLGGRLVYRDQQHLNADFVDSLGTALERKLPGAVAPPSNR